MLTDCTHCGATFRVTPAQLGASGGRVRCGLCSQVFDGFVRLRSEPEAAPSAAPAVSGLPENTVANAVAAFAPNDSAEVSPPASPEPPSGLPAEAPPDDSARNRADVTEAPPVQEVPFSAAESAASPQDAGPITGAVAPPEPETEVGDDDVELAFDAADAAELDGTLTDIEIPTDLPPVEPEDTVGADALAAIQSASEYEPEPGSEERAALEDTLTDIEIPTELLELTVVDEDEMPGAPSSSPPPANAPEAAVADADATVVVDPVPALIENGAAVSASPGDSPQVDAAPVTEAAAPFTDAAAPFTDAAAPSRQEPRAVEDDAPAQADTEEGPSAEREIIPGFPGFVPDDMPAAAAHPATTASPPPAAKPGGGRAGRAMMGVATALLALLLPVQGLLVFRDAIADRFPAVHPVLDGLCRQAGCRVPLPRRPEKLEIEASDLQALDPARPNRVVLIASIRNLASVTQAYPQLELTLTDPADHPLARRVFEPMHYLPETVAPDDGFAPRGEVSVRLQLDTGTVTPSGYRLFLFHR